MGQGGGTGWGGVEGMGENADNCNNKNKLVKKFLKKRKQFLQGLTVHLHSIFLTVNVYIFVKGYCGQLKLGLRVSKFSVNLNCMCKK